MSPTHFKTNRRLWIIFSSVLFVVPWFVPLIGKQEDTPLTVYPLLVWTGPSRADAFAVTLILAVFLGAIASVIGWVLQCVVVMFTQREEKPDQSVQ